VNGDNVEDACFVDKATEETEMLVEVVLAADDVLEDVVEVVEEDDLLDVDCVRVATVTHHSRPNCYFAVRSSCKFITCIKV
jgi:hypothetical protein